MALDATTARELALEALRRIDDEGAYANLLLGKMLTASTFSAEDRRFATSKAISYNCRATIPHLGG